MFGPSGNDDLSAPYQTGPRTIDGTQHRIRYVQVRYEYIEINCSKTFIIFAFLRRHRNKLELPVMEDAFGVNNRGDQQEIIEEFDEAKEMVWREEHRRKVRAQKELERNERQQPVEKSDKDVFKMLDELELMEELDTELEAMNIDSNEMLQELMSGARKLPETKERISSVTTEKACVVAPPLLPVESGKFWATSPITDRTNNNSVQNTIDFSGDGGIASDTDDSVASEDDLPAECRFYYQQAESLPNVEKLQFYKHHLAQVQSYLETTTVRTYDEFVSKTDKMFVADYLLNEIDRVRDLISGNEAVVKIDEKVPATIVVPDGTVTKQTTASHRRSVKFSNEDDIKSFSKCEEPRMVGHSSSSEKTINEPSTDGAAAATSEVVSNEEKERLKEYILKMAHMDVNEVKRNMDELYKKVR